MCAFTQRARVVGMVQSDFGRALAGAERRMERAAVELTRTRRLLDREDMAGTFGSAFAFSAEVEKLALLARVLPAYTGHPKATELTEQMLLDTVPAGKWNTGDLMADMHWDHYNVGWNDGSAAAVKNSIFARTSPAWDYTVLFDRKW